MRLQFCALADVFDAELPMLQRPLIVFLASTAVCSATVPVASKVNTSTVSCGWVHHHRSMNSSLVAMKPQKRLIKFFS
ncbi:hypothetical protein N9743_01980 [Flavobacteriaceae bacterium]|nr:hypothetical protein [Flavobacteriaceae bacterium]